MLICICIAKEGRSVQKADDYRCYRQINVLWL